MAQNLLQVSNKYDFWYENAFWWTMSELVTHHQLEYSGLSGFSNDEAQRFQWFKEQKAIWPIRVMPINKKIAMDVFSWPRDFLTLDKKISLNLPWSDSQDLSICLKTTDGHKYKNNKSKQHAIRLQLFAKEKMSKLKKRNEQARKAWRCDSYLQSETINDWPTDPLTGVGTRRCYCI